MDALLRIWPKIAKDSSILELGSNVGRQAFRLQTEGYTNILRTDLNPLALKAWVFKHTSPAEVVDLEQPTWLPGRTFDLIFTVAVLEHIYSDKVLDNIATKATKWICVCEDELHTIDTHKARNYQLEFEKRGWIQDKCLQVTPDTAFWARTFRKP